MVVSTRTTSSFVSLFGMAGPVLDQRNSICQDPSTRGNKALGQMRAVVHSEVAPAIQSTNNHTRSRNERSNRHIETIIVISGTINDVPRRRWVV
jgi:hypothetical protein